MKSEEFINLLEQEKERRANNATPIQNPQQRFMIAGEAPVLLGKACEFMVRELTLRSWKHTERCKRRTLQRQDIQAAIGENEVYDFLIDVVPRVEHISPVGVSSRKDYLGKEGALPQLNSTPLMNPMNDIGPEMNMAHLQQMQDQILLMQQHPMAHPAPNAQHGFQMNPGYFPPPVAVGYDKNNDQSHPQNDQNEKAEV